MNEGDVLIYSDACSRPSDVALFQRLALEHGIVSCECVHGQPVFTKRDTFLLMDADDQAERLDLIQRQATVIGFKNIPSVRAFVQEWAGYCTDARIVTDLPNRMGLPNHPSFIDHRHDQSVYSILTHKYGMGYFDHSLMKHHVFG